MKRPSCKRCKNEKTLIYLREYKNMQVLYGVCTLCGTPRQMKNSLENTENCLGLYNEETRKMILALKEAVSKNALIKKCLFCEKDFKRLITSKAHNAGFCTKKCKRMKRINNIASLPFKNKAKKPKKLFKSGDFYDSKEWKEMRYKVLSHYGRECMACGENKGQIHVDHIKPISIYWDLRLDFRNLQVLCRMCNQGKSNKDMTDFRPTEAQSQSLLNYRHRF